MPHLYFIRCRAASWYPYDEWTDVWVFGDVNGYETAERCLLDAAQSTSPIAIPSGPFTNNSMPVLILPISSAGDSERRLKIGEFVVSQSDQLCLQVVLCGNRLGYEYLAEQFQYARTQLNQTPTDHLHVDGGDLVQRSITLNIRGPVDPWSATGVEAYQSLFDRRVKLPGDAVHMKALPEDFQALAID